MNLIFLDVDGVLNSVNHLIKIYKQTHRPHSNFSYPFDPCCLENLKTLVEKTNSKLVITSTWRIEPVGRQTLLGTLKQYNMDQQVIGWTPILNTSRGIEIQTFLDNFKICRNPNFIILDDDSDMNHLLPHLIKTNAQTGLTRKNVDEAIGKLNKCISKRHDDFER